MLHSWPGKLPEMCDASGEALMGDVFLRRSLLHCHWAYGSIWIEYFQFDQITVSGNMISCLCVCV